MKLSVNLPHLIFDIVSTLSTTAASDGAVNRNAVEKFMARTVSPSKGRC